MIKHLAQPHDPAAGIDSELMQDDPPTPAILSSPHNLAINGPEETVSLTTTQPE
jgi:hypothetical protein